MNRVPGILASLPSGGRGGVFSGMKDAVALQAIGVLPTGAAEEKRVYFCARAFAFD